MLSKKLFSAIHKNILPLGLMIIILMMVLTSVFEVSHRKKASKVMLDTINQQKISSGLLGTMSQTILQRSILLIEILQSGDPFFIDELTMQLHSLASAYITARSELKEKSIDSHLEKLINEIDPLTRLNGPLQYEIAHLAMDDKKNEATALFINDALPVQKKVFSLIRKMEEHQVEHARDTLQQIKRETHNAHTLLKIFDIGSIILSILLTILIIKRQASNDRELAYQASTDALSGLPNRASFIKTTDQYIQSAPTSIFAVIFFDIDDFKTINDNYGHEIGDEILKRFSEQINSIIDDFDVLSRFGGDEFVLLLRSIKTKKGVYDFVSKLSDQLDNSYIIDDNEVFISTSIGASFYTPDIKDTKTMLRNADIAMYSAKKAGKNCHLFYSKNASDRMEKDHKISHALRTILKKDNSNTKELYLMYQPLLNIDKGDMTECEALIRWTTSEGDVIGPDEFIPLAEKSNLIERINLFVIDEACKQQYQWQKDGVSDIRININLSGNKLIFKNLLIHFKKNLEEMKLSPDLFGIELTERTLNDICQETISELKIVRDMGMKISIDDFGTDYSSLSNLKKLPITTLKIDKEFINGLPLDKNDHAMVKTIINLGHSLNLDIVAEGVETANQLDFLKKNSCNTVQGYYFHRPLHGNQISKIKLAA